MRTPTFDLAGSKIGSQNTKPLQFTFFPFPYIEAIGSPFTTK